MWMYLPSLPRSPLASLSASPALPIFIGVREAGLTFARAGTDQDSYVRSTPEHHHLKEGEERKRGIGERPRKTPRSRKKRTPALSPPPASSFFSKESPHHTFLLKDYGGGCQIKDRKRWGAWLAIPRPSPPLPLLALPSQPAAQQKASELDHATAPCC